MQSQTLEDPVVTRKKQQVQVLEIGVPVHAGGYTFTLTHDAKVIVESADVKESLVLHENLAWIVSARRTDVPLAHVESPLDRSNVRSLTILDWNEFPVAINVLYKKI